MKWIGQHVFGFDATFRQDVTIDGNLTIAGTTTSLGDSDKIILGDGSDAEIYVSGDDLYIVNTTDDKDVILASDDGSGGTAAYITLDGSAGYTTSQKEIRWVDAKPGTWGTSGDLLIWHTGTNSEIINYTGDLYFKQGTDDKDIIFQCDNGSGGLQTYMWMDGSAANGTNTYTRMDDNSMLGWGTGFDMYMYHNATNSYLTNATGDLYIGNGADDKDIIFQCDTGNGGLVTYFFLDGSAAAHNGSFTTAVYTQWGDRSHVAIGGAKDMQLYHDGSNSYIEQIDGATGSLIIQNSVDDGDIIFNCDDQSGGIATYMTIDGSTGNIGIGTTSPAAALHTYATTGIVSESPSNASITIRRNDNTNYSALLKYHTGNSEKWVAGLSDAGDFTDSTGVEYFIGTSKTAPKFLINSSGNVGIGTASPGNKLEVVGSFAANGPSSTFVTMGEGDTSPDVSTGNIFKTHSAAVTIDQFDGGVCGQIITIISGGATVYDVTDAEGANELKGGTTDITTAAGDVTVWVCESATVWHLISWMDLSSDLSSGGF